MQGRGRRRHLQLVVPNHAQHLQSVDIKELVKEKEENLNTILDAARGVCTLAGGHSGHLHKGSSAGKIFSVAPKTSSLPTGVILDDFPKAGGS